MSFTPDRQALVDVDGRARCRQLEAELVAGGAAGRRAPARRDDVEGDRAGVVALAADARR